MKISSRPSPNIVWPRAVLFVNDSAFAGVCAWCEGKGEADAWCRDHGYVATHTICPTCRRRMQDEVTCRRWVA